MTHLAIPQSAVAAAGRASTFMIAELTAANRANPNPLLGAEIMEMMDANKSFFSAAPVTEPPPCASCDHRQKMGITLLDAMWLDPACHKGCQSLGLKDRAAQLAEAMERLIDTDLDINGPREVTDDATAALAKARAALAAWKEGK
jgi:hypothetical protein